MRKVFLVFGVCAFAAATAYAAPTPNGFLPDPNEHKKTAPIYRLDLAGVCHDRGGNVVDGARCGKPCHDPKTGKVVKCVHPAIRKAGGTQ